VPLGCKVDHAYHNFSRAVTRTEDTYCHGFIVDEKWAGVLSADLTVRHVLRRIRLAYILKDIGVTKFNSRTGVVERIAQGKCPEPTRM
jgi:hypothetical protein